MIRRLVLALIAAVALAVGVLAGPAAFAVAPTITSFTPTSGPAGTQVTITGTNLTGATSVKFHGVGSRTITVVSATTIKAIVPSTASTGTISVTTPGGTATSTGTFTVTAGLTRTLSVGPPGTALSVSASGFGANEPVDLYFDTTDIYLALTDANGTVTIPVKIPTTATPGVHWFTAIGRRTGSAAQASFTVRTDWAQLGFDNGHSGLNPYENVLTPTTVDDATLRWSFDVGGNESHAQPAVSGGVVYVATGNGYLTAVDASTGTLKWRYHYGTDVLSTSQTSAPTVANGTVYIGSDDGGIYAVNAATGALRWKQNSRAIDGSPVVAGSVVYFGTRPSSSTDSASLVARNATTGALLWSQSFPAGEEVLAPSVSRGLVFVHVSGDGSVDALGELDALRASDGSTVWSTTTAPGAGGTPVVSGNRVCVSGLFSGADGDVTCVDAASGNLTWLDGYGDPGSYRALAAAGSRLIAGNTNGTFDAIDVNTGATIWSQTRPEPVQSNVTIAGGVVYGGTGHGFGQSDTHTEAFDLRTGTLLCTFGISGDGGVAISDGALYGTSGQQLLRYDLGPAAPVSRPAPAQLRPDRTLTAHPAA